MIKYLVCVLLIIILIIINKIQNNFEDIIGTFNGVDSYSNKENKTNLFDDNYHNGIYTGIKWQCVEYARRYLQITKGITFDNVDSAFQIPQAKFTKLDGSNVHLHNKLEVGSLIVWDKYYEHDAPDGHVGIISFIHNNGISVSEQNYDNKTFPRFIGWNDLKDFTIISFFNK
jgi:hypothetical protein